MRNTLSLSLRVLMFVAIGFGTCSGIWLLGAHIYENTARGAPGSGTAGPVAATGTRYWVVSSRGYDTKKSHAAKPVDCWVILGDKSVRIIPEAFSGYFRDVKEGAILPLPPHVQEWKDPPISPDPDRARAWVSHLTNEQHHEYGDKSRDESRFLFTK